MILTKDEFAKSLAADFSAAVEGTYQDLIKAAVAAEREACAKVCETEWSHHEEERAGKEFAAAIRARGNNA